MATMMPTTIAPEAPASEHKVFGALESGLPRDWTVVHGRRFVIPGRGRPLEGEVDFLILHPRRGYLALEVKGGVEIRREQDGWKSVRHDTGAVIAIKDPGMQAQSAAHAIHGYLEGHPVHGALLSGLRYGWGVCFPDFSVRGDLDAALRRGQIVDASDLEDIQASLERLFDAAGLPSQSVTSDTRRAFLDAVYPIFELVPSLGDRLRSEPPLLLHLTEEQTRAFELIDSQPRAAIRGPAGTGKTVIAMEKARRLASEGQRVLFLCFNRPLADHLAGLADGFTVSTFHALARRLATSAGLDFSPPTFPRDQEDFWTDTVPVLLLDALDRYPDERWDALVIDEGQDFRENWWAAITELLRDPANGRLLVFWDPNQNLYGGGPGAALAFPEFPLTYNCRNTVRIATYASATIGTQPLFRPSTPEGVKVREVECGSEAEMLDSVRKALHRLVVEESVPTESIVVMSPMSRDRSLLWRQRRFGNLQLMPYDRRPGSNEVRFTPLQRFKGLEADVVILAEVRSDFEGCSPVHLYVGTSRAKHVLEVHAFSGRPTAPDQSAGP